MNAMIGAGSEHKGNIRMDWSEDLYKRILPALQKLPPLRIFTRWGYGNCIVRGHL